MSKVKVKVLRIGEGENPQFEELMRRYQTVALKVDKLAEKKKEADEQLGILKELLKSEVLSIGLTRGSKLVVDGVGSFGFTRSRYYACKMEHRPELVDLLIDRDEKVLLTIGKKDLTDWATEVAEDEDQTLPDYVTFFDDKFVPRVTVDKTKATQPSNEETETS